MRKTFFASAVAVLALVGSAHATTSTQHRIECVGIVTLWPVHDFHDPELRNGVASLKFKDESHQDDDCTTRFKGKILTKVLKNVIRPTNAKLLV
jgi:hypothetical protein